jgi:hypothetical protein
MPWHIEISSIAQIISISLSNEIQLSVSESVEVRKWAKLAAPYWSLSAFCWKIDRSIFLPRSSFASRGKEMRRSRTWTFHQLTPFSLFSSSFQNAIFGRNSGACAVLFQFSFTGGIFWIGCLIFTTCHMSLIQHIKCYVVVSQSFRVSWQIVLASGKYNCHFPKLIFPAFSGSPDIFRDARTICPLTRNIFPGWQGKKRCLMSEIYSIHKFILYQRHSFPVLIWQIHPWSTTAQWRIYTLFADGGYDFVIEARNLFEAAGSDQMSRPIEINGSGCSWEFERGDVSGFRGVVALPFKLTDGVPFCLRRGNSPKSELGLGIISHSLLTEQNTGTKRWGMRYEESDFKKRCGIGAQKVSVGQHINSRFLHLHSTWNSRLVLHCQRKCQKANSHVRGRLSNQETPC